MGFLEDTLGDSPIVAAVKDEPGLERCLNSSCRVVFVLFGGSGLSDSRSPAGWDYFYPAAAVALCQGQGTAHHFALFSD